MVSGGWHVLCRHILIRASSRGELLASEWTCVDEAQQNKILGLKYFLPTKRKKIHKVETVLCLKLELKYLWKFLYISETKKLEKEKRKNIAR